MSATVVFGGAAVSVGRQLSGIPAGSWWRWSALVNRLISVGRLTDGRETAAATIYPTGRPVGANWRWMDGSRRYDRSLSDIGRPDDFSWLRQPRRLFFADFLPSSHLYLRRHTARTLRRRTCSIANHCSQLSDQRDAGLHGTACRRAEAAAVDHCFPSSTENISLDPASGRREADWWLFCDAP